MADQPKSAEEELVSKQVSDTDIETGEAAAQAPQTDAIPDAEVIDEQEAVGRPLTDPEPEADRAVRPDPEPAREPAPQPAAPPPRRSGAFLGFLLGGAIAAAGGFALARYLPDGWPVADTSALKDQIEQQAATVAALRAQVEALGARETPDLSGDLDQLRTSVEQVRSGLEARLSALPDVSALADQARSAAEGALAGLEKRLSDLETRPVAAGTEGATVTASGGATDGALAALQSELRTLKADLEAQRNGTSGASDELRALAEQTQAQIAAAAAEAGRLKSAAETAGQAALARAAVARMRAALDLGEPFSSAVAELTETGHEVPEVLAGSAASGIPSLTQLQRGFPPAARAALNAALRDDMGETWTERAASFLRTQTGARSLVPLEGDHADAILSRAEAALTGGDLSTALSEVAKLPDAAQAPLANWVADAKRREAAIAAVASLSTSLEAE